jgi:hypothetical protein
LPTDAALADDAPAHGPEKLLASSHGIARQYEEMVSHA